LEALTAAQQQGQAVACGGCGNADPEKVCIGCLHPFAAPPIAPVGVEDAGSRAVAAELLRCFESWEPGVRVLGNVQARDGADLMRRILAQQPSVAPVGVEWTDDRIIAVCKAAGVRWIEADEEEGGFPGGFDITHMPEMRRLFTALAQQPAAVDEAMAERFCRRWYEITGRSLERAHVLASLDAALATQHQEPTT